MTEPAPHGLPHPLRLWSGAECEFEEVFTKPAPPPPPPVRSDGCETRQPEGGTQSSR